MDLAWTKEYFIFSIKRKRNIKSLMERRIAVAIFD